MLISVYVALLVLGVVLCVAGLVSGSAKLKLGLTVSLLLVSTIFFSVIGLESLNIEKEYCTTSSPISCVVQRHSEEGVGALFGGLVLFNIAMMFVYVLSGREKPSWD